MGRACIYGLGISSLVDKVLGDCVQAGVVTDEGIDGATGVYVQSICISRQAQCIMALVETQGPKTRFSRPNVFCIN